MDGAGSNGIAPRVNSRLLGSFIGRKVTLIGLW